MTSLVDSWLQECETSRIALEDPVFPSARALLSTSGPATFTLGTGYSILSSTCDYVLAKCQDELIFVTCFWAASPSLERVSALLLGLSAKAAARNTKIRVRICFSSLSIWQKLSHTQSPAGRIWQPEEWQSQLGLPPPHMLSGLDLRIKSIFMLPFSVMHPKFIVIDRRSVILPSCNVSWENWFEGAVRLDGEIAECGFVKFFESFWFRESVDGSSQQSPARADDHDLEAGYVHAGSPSSLFATESTGPNHLNFPVQITLATPQPIRTLFLPSRHHRNPQFRPFPWQTLPIPPPTPLNKFVLHLLDNATTSIFLQTPNITSPPVLASLANAFARGVSVRIVTNERLMFWEQVVTAGTTTPACLNALIARHQQLKAATNERQGLYRRQNSLPPGSLRVSYFSSEPGVGESQDLVPVSSHLKMTVVDGEVVVLGSGNMDRASWYTSQELGVAFESKEMVEAVMKEVEKVDVKCCRVVYDG